jgi:hypothetical protein
MGNIHMSRGPRQKQMGVVLSDEIRAGLEAAAARNGCSLGEEIRKRLQRTLREDLIKQPLRNLMSELVILASWTKTQTGQDWRTHPAANSVLKYAINARLARMRKSGPETFAPGELPENRMVAPGSNDPESMGLSLEARLDGMMRQWAARKGWDYPSADAEDAVLQLFWETIDRNIEKIMERKKEEKNSDGTS